MNRIVGFITCYFGIMIMALVIGFIEALFHWPALPWETVGGVVCIAMFASIIPIAAFAMIWTGISAIRKGG